MIIALLTGVMMSQAWAASGADVLLNSVAQPGLGAQAPLPAGVPVLSASTQAMLNGEIKLDDPFVMQLFASWQSEHGLPYEVNAWVLSLLKHQHAEAAHLWSLVEPKLPATFQDMGKAAWLYSLWKIDVPQTFFDQWVQAMTSSPFANSRGALALDQVIGPNFDQWVQIHSITVSPEQEIQIAGLDKGRGMHFLTLHGWAALRHGEKAAAILPNLPIGHSLKIPLAQTAALALAKRGDLAGAAKLMKVELEPAIEATHSPLALSNHYLQVARLLYQAGVLDSAQEFYEKIPNSAPEFLKAREELTWVLLRKGETQKLRGELTTLSNPVFDGKFAPELYLVRAISNLKLCFYNQVEKDFSDFTRLNAGWARRIEAALKGAEPPKPELPDYFSRMAESALEKRTEEVALLDRLGVESIHVALPAVGPQSHWVRLKDRMLAQVEVAKKTRAQEYRRQWKNQRTVLVEAIRKMQFVKVELMSQVRELSRAAAEGRAPGTDAVALSRAAPVRKEEVRREQGEISFPFDGVLWPDEMFKLRSLAQDRCLQRGI